MCKGRQRKKVRWAMLLHSHQMTGPSGVADAAVRRAARCTVEALENRRLLSVDAAGWTVLAPSSDSRVIYVDNVGGKDTNSGFSASAPVSSWDKAVSLTRSGYPDWILLKRGTVFNRAVTNWNRSGRSAEQPMVISSYGPASA